MSILTGLGRGIAGAGDVVSKMFLLKEQRQRENDAIQRALMEQGAQDSFRSRTLAHQDASLAEQKRMNDASLAQNRLRDATTMAMNFPGAPLGEEMAGEWMKDERAPLVMSIPGQTQAELSAMPGAVGQLFGTSDPSKFQQGPTTYALRPSESEKMRVEAIKNANRIQVQTMRNAALERRLAMDKELQAMKNSLSREQLASIEARTDAMLNYNYDALDQRTAAQNAENAAQIMAAEIRAEAMRGRQNFLFNIPGLAPQGGEAPAAPPPAAPRTPPVIAPPTRRGQGGGGGEAPPPRTLADALRERANQKKPK